MAHVDISDPAQQADANNDKGNDETFVSNSFDGRLPTTPILHKSVVLSVSFFRLVIIVTTRMKKHITTANSGNCSVAGRL